MDQRHSRHSEDRSERWLDLWDRLIAHPRARQAYPTEDAVVSGGLMYGDVLADVDIDVLEAAAVQCLARCDWFPSPANLREAAETMVDLQYPTALEGWAEVRIALSAQGIYKWQNPVAKAVAEAMGMHLLRISDRGGADQKRFIDEYNERVRREKAQMRIVEPAKQVLEGARIELAASRADRFELSAAPAPVEASTPTPEPVGMRRLPCPGCGTSGFVPSHVDAATFRCPSCRRKESLDAERAAERRVPEVTR